MVYVGDTLLKSYVPCFKEIWLRVKSQRSLISSFYDLLSKNQIEKVDILTSTSGNTAEVTLKKAAYVASKDEELKKLTKEQGPHYLVKDVGSLDLFQNELK